MAGAIGLYTNSIYVLQGVPKSKHFVVLHAAQLEESAVLKAVRFHIQYKSLLLHVTQQYLTLLSS